MSEPCCPADRCIYQPHKIRQWLALFYQLYELAESPRTALHQLEGDRDSGIPSPEPQARVRSTGGDGTGDGRTGWVDIAMDIESARRAGCRTAEEYARHLCPFSGVVVENIRDLDRD